MTVTKVKLKECKKHISVRVTNSKFYDKENKVLCITNGETGDKNKLPTDYQDLSKLIRKEALPDENNPNYFCCVCQQRAESKTAYHQHLRSQHQMDIKPLSNWRTLDPEVIPTECDTSFCCLKCQKVHDDEKSYWEHLKKDHHTYIMNHSPSKRKARNAVVFNRNLNDDVRLANIELANRDYTCIICRARRSSMINLSNHYFKTHSILVEFHKPPVKPKIHSNSLITPAFVNRAPPDAIIDVKQSLTSVTAAKKTNQGNKR